MTGIQADSPPSTSDRLQDLVDWARNNSTLWMVATGVLIAGVLVYLFVGRLRLITNNNAERALNSAKQSLNSGNLPLAQSDLEKVYSRYGSTPAGVEAALLLASLDYDAGKVQDGINVLEKASGTGAAANVRATILSLEGDGYAQLKKLGEAGKQYEAAAAATSFQTEKAALRAKAARTYQQAGDTAKARRLWADLEADPTATSVAAEARVRLGELTAQPAKR
jgi:predicted negative regulator of RcsB-dependent stress response